MFAPGRRELLGEDEGRRPLRHSAVKGVAITVSDVTKRRESEERLRSQSRELALLHRVRTAVARELEVPGVLARAVEAVAETYGDTRMSAYLLEGGELVLQHRVGYREGLGRIPLTKGIFARALRAGRPLLVEDVSPEPDSLGSTEGATSEICVPLFDEGEAVALLDLESLEGVKLTENDLRLMTAVSEHVDLAISRARLYARVRYSEERYRALTQNSSDLVTVIETSGIVRYQSPAVVRMLGYSQEELRGKNAFDYVHPDDLQRVKMAYDEGLNDPGLHPSAEYRFRHKNGSWRWLESVGTNLIQEPGVGDTLSTPGMSRGARRPKTVSGRPRNGTVCSSSRYRLLLTSRRYAAPAKPCTSAPRLWTSWDTPPGSAPRPRTSG